MKTHLRITPEIIEKRPADVCNELAAFIETSNLNGVLNETHELTMDTTRDCATRR